MSRKSFPDYVKMIFQPDGIFDPKGRFQVQALVMQVSRKTRFTNVLARNLLMCSGWGNSAHNSKNEIMNHELLVEIRTNNGFDFRPENQEAGHEQCWSRVRSLAQNTVATALYRRSRPILWLGIFPSRVNRSIVGCEHFISWAA